jgi:hypothetical protein
MHYKTNIAQGSASCIESRRVLQNLRNAAKSQGCLNWYIEIQNAVDKSELLKLVNNYKVRTALAGGTKKMGVFPVLVYREEVRKERPLTNTTLLH